MTYNYEEIKALAKELKRPVTSLIALAPANDPFYVGTDRDLRLGTWFANLWLKFGYQVGVHIRRMHYAIVSQNPPVMMPNGKLYENTEECWEMLTQASKCARYLELVDPAAFVDRRNGEPQDNLDYYTEHLAQAQIYGGAEDDKLALPAFPDLPQYSLYVSSPQRYHIEIWCEKSTMADILGGLARQYNAVYQDGMGELSITVALDAIRRFERSGKPVRIFYVSDFDPAGAGMPVSMSRKIEYFLHKLGLELDVKLFPIVLTYAQVKQYTRILPTPIKESERRKDRFEARYGKGAVELDALEALYPGELARILRRAIGEYYDASLERKVADARRRIEQQLIPIQRRVYADHDAEIAELRDLHAEIERQIAQQMEAFSTRKSELWLAMREELEQEQPDIDENDVPEANYAREDDNALFDSARSYLTQNTVYQEHKGRNTYEEETEARA